MKKYPFILIPLVLTALVGCNGGGNSTPEGSTSKDFSGKITINFWHTFGDKAETALEGKVAQFSKLVKETRVLMYWKTG